MHNRKQTVKEKNIMKRTILSKTTIFVLLVLSASSFSKNETYPRVAKDGELYLNETTKYTLKVKRTLINNIGLIERIEEDRDGPEGLGKVTYIYYELKTDGSRLFHVMVDEDKIQDIIITGSTIPIIFEQLNLNVGMKIRDISNIFKIDRILSGEIGSYLILKEFKNMSFHTACENNIQFNEKSFLDCRIDEILLR